MSVSCDVQRCSVRSAVAKRSIAVAVLKKVWAPVVMRAACFGLRTSESRLNIKALSPKL